ncbi:hypothetical protein FLK61_23715 [Paenalkalicoccus suaedae]|uniref:Uncharacterized protein n=1 Tax=Paenalkalicoccus suaedae TaxID=2592382 RepID=A0A859FAX9_9BACI|nr:hypothetical protein [Paenalkalicoccus suaedae]QKS69801.1 hypothetical protein FLK61_23715 [Paenalkalicoccus suaedae]
MMNRRTLAMVVYVLGLIIVISNNYYQTFVGDILMTVSVIAAAITVIGGLYYLIKFAILLRFSKNKNLNQ